MWKRHFWWRQIVRHLHVQLLQFWAKFSDFQCIVLSGWFMSKITKLCLNLLKFCPRLFIRTPCNLYTQCAAIEQILLRRSRLFRVQGQSTKERKKTNWWPKNIHNCTWLSDVNCWGLPTTEINSRVLYVVVRSIPSARGRLKTRQDQYEVLCDLSNRATTMTLRKLHRSFPLRKRL